MDGFIDEDDIISLPDESLVVDSDDIAGGYFPQGESVISETIDSSIAPVIKGVANLKQTFNVGQAAFPNIPLFGQDIAGASADIAQAERTKQFYPSSELTQRGFENIGKAEGFVASGKAMFTPAGLSAVGSTIVESGISSLPAIGGMAISALTGGAVAPVIAALAAGAGSGATEYSASLLDYGRQQGIDITDAVQVEQFFENPEVFQAASEFAKSRAAPIPIIDAISAGAAGNLFNPKKALHRGASKAEVAARSMGETLAQGLAGGTGEALAQESSGQDFSASDILMEAVAELGTGVAETALGSVRQRPESESFTDEQQIASIDKVDGVVDEDDIRIRRSHSKQRTRKAIRIRCNHSYQEAIGCNPQDDP